MSAPTTRPPERSATSPNGEMPRRLPRSPQRRPVLTNRNGLHRNNSRRPGRHPFAGGARCRRHLRHPRRCRVAGLRPAFRLCRSCATSWSATSRAPAAPPAGTRTPPAGRCVHGDVGSRCHQPGDSAGRRPHGLDTGGGDHRPGRPRADRHRTPSRKPTSPASPCRSPSTTSWSATATSRGCWPRPSTSRRPAVRSGARRYPQGRPAGPVHVQLAAGSSCPDTSRTPSRTTARCVRPPSSSRGPQAGALRRRRRHRGEATEQLLDLAELTGIPSSPR